MRYWLDLFTGTTWDEFRGSGASVAGFTNRMHRTVQAIQEGAIGEEHVTASIGEIAAGQRPGRRSPDEITIFKSVGLAVEDVATAGRVYQLARAAGIGREIDV